VDFRARKLVKRVQFFIQSLKHTKKTRSPTVHRIRSRAGQKRKKDVAEVAWEGRGVGGGERSLLLGGFTICGVVSTIEGRRGGKRV